MFGDVKTTLNSQPVSELRRNQETQLMVYLARSRTVQAVKDLDLELALSLSLQDEVNNRSTIVLV